jgi:hypothetical protein
MPTFLSWIFILYSFHESSVKFLLPSRRIKQPISNCIASQDSSLLTATLFKGDWGTLLGTRKTQEKKAQEFSITATIMLHCRHYICTWACKDCDSCDRIVVTDANLLGRTKCVNWQWGESTETHSLNSWGSPDNSVNRANKLGNGRSRNLVWFLTEFGGLSRLYSPPRLLYNEDRWLLQKGVKRPEFG